MLLRPSRCARGRNRTGNSGTVPSLRSTAELSEQTRFYRPETDLLPSFLDDCAGNSPRKMEDKVTDSDHSLCPPAHKGFMLPNVEWSIPSLSRQSVLRQSTKLPEHVPSFRLSWHTVWPPTRRGMLYFGASPVCCPCVLSGLGLPTLVALVCAGSDLSSISQQPSAPIRRTSRVITSTVASSAIHAAFSLTHGIGFGSHLAGIPTPVHVHDHPAPLRSTVPHALSERRLLARSAW